MGPNPIFGTRCPNDLEGEPDRRAGLRCYRMRAARRGFRIVRPPLSSDSPSRPAVGDQGKVDREVRCPAGNRRPGREAPHTFDPCTFRHAG